jgi:O-antigen ligase
MKFAPISDVPRAQSILRITPLWFGSVVAATFLGAVAAGRVQAWLGGQLALLIIAAIGALATFAVFSFVGEAAVLAWPVVATGGYLLQYPHGHPVIKFDRIWILGLVAYVVLEVRRIPRTRSTRILLFGLVWLVASYGIRAFATDSSLSGPPQTWVDAILLPAVLFVACERYCLRGAARGRALAASLAIAGGVLGTIGIAERIFGFELATVTGGSVRFDALVDATRISGPYPVPETYVLTLTTCLAATLYWIVSRPRHARYGWALALVGVQLTAIALALFRAGWIAAILVVIASAGIRPGRSGRMFGLITLVAIFAALATTQLEANPTVSTRVNDTENINGRLATYRQGLEIFQGSPVFGIGVNQYLVVAQRRAPEIVNNVASVPYPHSSYVGLLAEQGVIGFLPLLFLSFAVWGLLTALRAASFWSREAMLLLGPVAGATLAYLIMSLTLTMLPYGPSNAYFAALLGLTAGRLDAIVERGRVKGAVQ